MRRLALLVPHPADPAYAARWPPAFGGYAALFRRHGVELVAHPWTEPLAEPTAALALLAWGYHIAPERWLERLARWPADIPLLNSPATLRWNTHKGYLAELAAGGAPVVPTAAVERPAAGALAAAFASFGTAEVVVKPQLSAGARSTVRLRPGEAAPADLRQALIQPYLPAVETEGELSLCYFAGRFSHAVRKVAAPGDFRVQPQFGGRLCLMQPNVEVLEAASAVLAAASRLAGPFAYARVDMVRGPGGRLALMELEAIEPDLYLHLAPDGGDSFAQAVLAALAA